MIEYRIVRCDPNGNEVLILKTVLRSKAYRQFEAGKFAIKATAGNTKLRLLQSVR